ncbi:PH domain-containing protein [Nocardiopsis sp. HNM0947]|uniref:PH domain-containing protein n=2 Tax=Nocardiopsis coralli TaxID=2772213 RepID=A0ABR9P6Y5_9ACTN|nr:PH domain-containing protein [Nocardiopsis coralli]
MVVGPINQLRSILLPILIGLVIGGFNPWLLAATGATVVMLLVGGFVTWQTLRYEITDDRIEIRKGLIRRERRTIPLERIRGVDVTSSLLHRMLGVSVVHIEAAAGSMATEDGKLDAVDAAEADRLRGELLRRRAVLTETGEARTEGDEEPAAAEPETVTYFEMPRSWYLFGALSLAHLLTPFALLATAIGLLQQSAAQMEAATDTVVGWIDATDRALLTTLAIGIPVALVLLMPVFAVVSYTVTNWGFTLKGREGSLVAERGLLTRRSVTLEKRRIRGHELQDNPLERTRSAVRLRAIVTGLGEVATRAVLLPTGPRPQVASVVERALDRYDGGLRRHPRAALSRRLIRSVGPFLLTGAVGVALDWNWLVIASAVMAVLGVPLGIDRYRSLGHGYDGAYVSVRSGSLQRGQAVVERSAVIGWTWTQTLFQRRSGLANLQVTVGAGAGGYTAQDASLPGSVAFAADVTPAMVRPFLVERGTSSAQPGPSGAGVSSAPEGPESPTGPEGPSNPTAPDAPERRDAHDGESPRTADEDR